MNLLPKWVLPSPFPAVYDSESFTAIEMVSKVYGAMNTLIEEYNKFADTANAAFAKFSTDETEARNNFEESVTKVYRQFMCQMENYLKLNLDDTATKMIQEGINNGSIPIPTDAALAMANFPADAKATGEAIAVERARINQLSTMSEGSTTGDAELQDVRVDHDGHTHPNAGTAVRTQTKAAQDKTDYLHDKLDISYELGSLSTTSGIDSEANNRIRSSFIPLTGGKMRVFIPDGTKARAIFYKADQSVTAASDYWTEPHDFETHGYSYARILAAYADDSAVGEVSTLASKISVFFPGEYHDSYHGNVIKLGYTTFNACKKPGYYSYTAANLETIKDKPDDLTGGGILEVFPYAATNVVFQRIRNTSGEEWFRYGSNPFTKKESSTGTGGSSGGFSMNWIALGDSITEGYYSVIEDGAAKLKLDAAKSWAKLAAGYNGWNLLNYAIGGTGYVSKNPSTGNNKKNIREVVTELAADHKFQEADLVTLFAGCNDWKYNLPMGSMDDDIATGGTLYSNMRWCINKILEDNPHIKIVVISPANCSLYGTAADRYGIGYKFSNNGTLEDICEAQRKICEYYGLEFVDVLHGSFINLLNINEVLPDKVHPSINGHVQLAKELSRKIMGVNPDRTADPRKYEEIYNETFAEDTQNVSITGLNLEKIVVIASIEAAGAASSVYVDIKTDAGEWAANCYIGNGVYTAARSHIVNAEIQHGYTNVTYTAASPTPTIGTNLFSPTVRRKADGFSEVQIYPNSGKFPAGSTIKVLGLKNL